jgi:hypothetical protein
VRDGDVLIETRQGSVEAAGEPKGAIEKHALGVADVVQELPDGPFIGRVAVERFFFRDVGEEAERGIELRFKFIDDILTGDAIDVGGVIVRGFGGRGASGHGDTVALDRGREQPLLWWECRVSS